MVSYADVIVDILSEKLDRSFQYRIPEEMQDKISAGVLVMVPFGRGNRLIRAYVTGVSGTPGIDPEKIKPIAEVITEGLGSEERLVLLAGWMKEYYGAAMAQALRTVIPVKRKIRTVEKTTILRKCSREEAEAYLEEFQRKHQTARARLTEALIEESEWPLNLLKEKCNITSAVIHSLEKMEIAEVSKERVYRNPDIGEMRAQDPVVLNEEQQYVVDVIRKAWDSCSREETGEKCRFLLQGVTGSGKTEVYMELIEHAISRGEQAIMLIPEIALTWQMVLRFRRRFGDRVSFIHSRLSAGERYDQYERAKNGQIDVMIGPRSALFTPFPRLGIIVMDEEQESAYQSESVPRYHARETAAMRAQLEGAVLLLGSATPSLEAYYAAQEGRYTLLKMQHRVKALPLPSVHVVDMRQELRNGNRSMISSTLRSMMEERLQKGEQTMLFLNRRGYAGIVTCRSCGYVAKCPHCDVSLSLHSGGRMICHYCGYEENAPEGCPSCRNGKLKLLRAGTQQVEEEVRRIFPRARTLRMDLDTTREKDAYTSILSAFAGHEADILIGTQMIVKGHDFPDVTLVGILAADLSLYVPDYRSSERTFQLLTQAAGRAGRGFEGGEVAVQTYSPEHYSITCAASQDYESFYQQEILHREMAGYPPAGCLISIHMSGPDEEKLKTAAGYLKLFIERAAGRERLEKGLLRILGPTPEAVSKIQDQYRMALYMKSADRRLLQRVRQKSEEYISMNSGFAEMTIQYEAG